MEIKYIDYAIDSNGFIARLNNEKIIQTEHNIHRIRMYSTMEQSDTTDYIVSIQFDRADGLVIGPLPMTYAQDDYGRWHRYFDLKEKLTEVRGELKYTINFEQWRVNESGVSELQKRLPSVQIKTAVLEANNNIFEQHYEIYRRLLEVEIKADQALANTSNFIYSENEPVYMDENTIWLKPIEDMED